MSLFWERVNLLLPLHTLWPISRESFRVLVSSLPGSPAVPIASRVECERPMLGDGWIPCPDFASTRSVSVVAEASTVWPWLAQMMRGGGLYGWSKLEACGGGGKARLVPGLNPPSIGDRCGGFFEVVGVEPGQEVVWSAIAPLSLLDVTLERLTLNYRLEPRGRHCRVIVRTRAVCHDATAPLRAHAFRVLDDILPGQQLLKIKRFVERNGAPACGSMKPPGALGPDTS